MTTAPDYIPTTTLPVEGRIFVNMERRVAVRLIASLARALAESDSDSDIVELEVAMWNASGTGWISIGSRNMGMLASGDVVDSGLHVNDKWGK